MASNLPARRGPDTNYREGTGCRARELNAISPGLFAGTGLDVFLVGPGDRPPRHRRLGFVIGLELCPPSSKLRQHLLLDLGRLQVGRQSLALIDVGQDLRHETGFVTRASASFGLWLNRGVDADAVHRPKELARLEDMRGMLPDVARLQVDLGEYRPQPPAGRWLGPAVIAETTIAVGINPGVTKLPAIELLANEMRGLVRFLDVTAEQNTIALAHGVPSLGCLVVGGVDSALGGRFFRQTISAREPPPPR